jgi:hypothetical protein
MGITDVGVTQESAQQLVRSLAWPEARFRISASNASPRSVRVIFLSDNDVDVLLSRARGVRPHVVFSGPADFRALMGRSVPGAGAEATTSMNPDDLKHLRAWLATPDLVVIVGGEDDDPGLGILAANEYRRQSVTISGLIRRTQGAASTHSSTSNASNALRPLCSMIVLVNDSGYLDEMLDALGAKE